MRAHERSAQRHDAAAALWDTRHQAGRAEFERRCASIEREAAALDGERSRLERLRIGARAQPDAAAHAEIDRVGADLERRRAQLLADDAALERERDRLWRPDERREHRRGRVSAASQRDPVAWRRAASLSAAAQSASSAAGRLGAQTRENARHLSSVLSRTAELLATTAASADAHAERLELARRSDAGAQERRVAARAREAARRAQAYAENWLVLGGER
jgi:hypothetical protein